MGSADDRDFDELVDSAPTGGRRSPSGVFASRPPWEAEEAGMEPLAPAPDPAVALRPVAGEGSLRSLTDRLWDAVATTPGWSRFARWIGPILVTLLAAGTRLWNLGSPHSLVFDETFYVKDAYTLQQLGYEGSWPTNTDAGFASGHIPHFLSSASFVVHPPLGKWMISLGYLIFGIDSPWGWRISTAVVGILAVVLVMIIARYLFQSTLVATIAGLLMAIDGNAIVMSRVALLDNFVMFFALLGFGAILLDRQWSERRLAYWMARRDKAGKGTDWGPALWWRPWLIAAGLAFGLTSAVKWNGLYFLAGFALYSLISDALARRRAGIPFWLSGTLFKQAPTTFLLMVPIALAGYLTTWIGWFATKGGYDRQWAETTANAWTGALSWVPRSLQSFWHYENEIYNYNINEHTPHPYQANPLTWLLMIRPTSMYYQGSNQGVNGCTVTYCGESITGIANPLIWWGATAAVLYLVYRLIRFREWRVGLILAGVGAGYLPWLLYTNRTVFQFYTIAFEPYMILALAFVASQLIGARGDPPDGRRRGGAFVAVFLVLAVAISVFFWPLWTGLQVDFNFIRAHYWLETWR